MNYHQRKYNLILSILIVVCIFFKSEAQLLSSKDEETDTELWTGLDFEKKITKKIDLSFSFQTRLRENITIIRSNFGQVGLSFPLQKDKKLKATTSIRFTRNESANWRIRPIIDIAYGAYKNNLIDLTYRTRFQRDFKTNSSETSFIFFDEVYWRHRLMLKYRNLENFEPFLGAAIFTNVGRQSLIADQFRIITGFSYKISKRHDLKLSYIYREQFNTKNQGANHIISAKFYFEIKNFKKKNKKGVKEKKTGLKEKESKKSNLTEVSSWGLTELNLNIIA